MEQPLHIELYCEGDILACLGQAKKIAGVRDDLVKVQFNGFSVAVWPDSKVTDLMTIYSLKKELMDYKNEQREET